MNNSNTNSPVGIYIHIPFCQRVCIYCDFYVTTARKFFVRYTEAVIQELGASADQWKQAPVDSIYFGGGTPSYLPADELEKIIHTVFRNFDVKHDAEITLEANPGDLTYEKLVLFKRIGFNRLSVGVQSFDNKELQFLSRNHTADEARDCIRRAQDASFSNISLDLMFGLPGQTLEGWEKNVEAAAALKANHISIYNLTYEERTHLFKLLQQKKITPADEDTEFEMFSRTTELLGGLGYEHYEISNFAKIGYQSRHNRSYWQGQNYLGVGPSAHSYDGKNRWWNVRDIRVYCEMASDRNKTPVETSETLTNSQLQIEYLLLNFRQKKGIDLKDFKMRFGVNFRDRFRKAINKTDTFLIIENDTIRLNPRGLFLYNKICLEFAAETD